MKLKPVKKLVPKREEKKSRKSSKNTLPPDEYTPMFEPTRILVRETVSSKDPTKVVRQFLEISVKRYDDDEAKPFVWVQMYQESEFYTGYLKGKTIYMPLSALFDFIDSLNDIGDECEERGIRD